MKTIFTCLFVGLALFVSAQQNTFKVRAFAPDYSYIAQLIQLNDGSFVGVGTYHPDESDGIADLYLLKTDAGGTVLSSTIVKNSSFSSSTSLIKNNRRRFCSLRK